MAEFTPTSSTGLEGCPTDAQGPAPDSAPPSSSDARELILACMEELRQIAHRLFRRERIDHTLQPTGLVNELWRRLPEEPQAAFPNREAFLAWAARSMRHILVDHARSRGAARRGGGWTRCGSLSDDLPGGLPDRAGAGRGRNCSLAEIDDEIRVLERVHPRSAKVVELRFFGGMSNEQIASLLKVSARVIQDDWKVARLWLRGRLDERSTD